MNRNGACKHINLLKVVHAKRRELQMGGLSSGNLKEEKVETSSSIIISPEVMCGRTLAC
jgi:hypothetical protein